MAPQVPKSIFDTVDPIFRQAGVPSYIWQSIAAMETGGKFDPGALGDYKDGQPRSFGLFQLFTDGGQGDAYASNPKALLDPALNASIAVGPIATAYNYGRRRGLAEGPEMAAYVAAHSGHPNATPAGAPAVARVYEWARQFWSGEDPGPGAGAPFMGEDLDKGAFSNQPGAAPPSESSSSSIFTAEFWKKAGLLTAVFLIGLVLIGIGAFSLIQPGDLVKKVV